MHWLDVINKWVILSQSKISSITIFNLLKSKEIAFIRVTEELIDTNKKANYKKIFQNMVKNNKLIQLNDYLYRVVY